MPNYFDEDLIGFEFDLIDLDDPVIAKRVFGNKEKEAKERTIVCRFWMRGLCGKGEKCEYLHQADPEKMPECKNGTSCPTRYTTCIYKHIEDEDKAECSLFRQGFCPHGPVCRYRHLRRKDLPDVADFSIGRESLAAQSEKVTGFKRPAHDYPKGENFKVQLCKNFMRDGNCPYGDDCHFAHGDHDLLHVPKKPKIDFVSLNMDTRPVEELHLPNTGTCRYFLVKPFNFASLAISAKRGEWAVHSEKMFMLNQAFQMPDVKVFLFFSVDKSFRFQGVAQMVGPVDPSTTVQAQIGRWYRLKVNWVRMCDVPGSVTDHITNPLAPDTRAPAVNSLSKCRDGSELSNEAGEELFELIYRSPLQEVDLEKVTGDLVMIPDTNTNIIGDGGGTRPPLNLESWKVTSEGFIAGCRKDTETESLTRLLFGFPPNLSENIKFIEKGTPLLLMNVETHELHGIFEAEGHSDILIDETAFIPILGDGDSCLFPLQLKVSRKLICPPMHVSELNTVIEKGISIRKLDIIEMQQLVDLFTLHANKCASIMEIPAAPGKKFTGSEWEETIYVDFDPVRDFGIAGKLIGNHGENMKKIVQAAGGGKIRVRGKGSNYKEGPMNREADVPLQVYLAATEEDAFENAKNLVVSLLRDIKALYKDWIKGFIAQGGELVNNVTNQFGGNRGGYRGRGGFRGGGGYRGGRGGFVQV